MRTRSLLIALALVLVAAGGVAVSLWQDALEVRTLLSGADADADAARAALARDRDPAEATRRITQGVEKAEEAAAIVDRATWALAARLPSIGDDVRTVRAATRLAEAGARVAAEALEPAAAIASDEGLATLIDGARIDVAALRDLGAALAEVDTEVLRERTEQLEAIDASDTVTLVADARRRALSAANELLAAVDGGGTALAGLVDLLGGDGQRTYLLAAQNPAELRGTGGLIGFLAEVTVDEGDLTIGEGLDFDPDEYLLQRTATEGSRTARLDPPVERPDDFADRYDRHGGGQFIGSVNIDPDLPTVAPVLLRLYARETGRDLDGVILVDPIALADLVSAMGAPLELPPELETAGLPSRLRGQDIPRAIMIDGYDAFGGGGPAKKAFDAAIINAAFEQLFTGDWPAEPVIRAMRRSVGQRHVQAWSASETAQTAILLADAGGAMPDPAESGDLLSAVAINGGPNKADVHVAHRVTANVVLDRRTEDSPGVLRRDLSIDFAVENPLRPDDHVQYITQSRDLTPFGEPDPSSARQDALVRTFVNVWVPERTYATTLFDTVGGELLDFDRVHGIRVIDAFLETPSASTTSLAFTATGDVLTRVDGEQWIYDLELWRQAKAIPDHWDITIEAPAGWRIVTADVIGGGDGTGLGVGGDGTPLRATMNGGRVTVRGAATADATIRLTLEP